MGRRDFQSSESINKALRGRDCLFTSGRSRKNVCYDLGSRTDSETRPRLAKRIMVSKGHCLIYAKPGAFYSTFTVSCHLMR